MPRPVRDVVARCLAPDPAQRPTPAQLLPALTGDAPTSTRWLPRAVRTLVEQHGSAGDATRPATLHDTAPAPAAAEPALGEPAAAEPAAVASRAPGIAGGAVRFTTSRRAAVTRGAVLLAGAGVTARLADPAAGAPAALRLVAFLVCCSLAVLGVRWLVRTVRHPTTVGIGAQGIQLSRGAVHWRVAWSSVLRIRVADPGRHPRLLVWLTPDVPAPPLRLRREHGGLCLLAVAQGRRRRHRGHQVAELRAELRWYAPGRFDPAP